MTTKITKLLAAVTFCCMALAVLAGCSQSSANTASGAKGTAATTAIVACMAPPAVAATDKPVIAVLTGITANDAGPALAARRKAAITRVTEAGFQMDARLLIDVIGGSDPGDLAVNTQLDTPGANQLFRQSAAQCKRQGVTAAVSQIQAQATTSRVDVLGALERLDGHLTGLTNRHVDVVMLSNMVNSTPALPLDNPVTLTRDPRSLVDGVAEAGLLPDCRGWDMYLIGAGNTPGKGLDDQGRARLRAFWTVFFARCGGRVVAYDSELTQFPLTPTATPPVATDAVAEHPDPTPPLSPKGVAAPHKITITLADTVLFDNASATLSPSADAALTQAIAGLGPDRRVGAISVQGYTDTTPAILPGGNLGLSLRRAQAVADWLTGHGIPAGGVHPTGMGPADPVADNATHAGRARNRRVEITYTTRAT